MSWEDEVQWVAGESYRLLDKGLCRLASHENRRKACSKNTITHSRSLIVCISIFASCDSQMIVLTMERHRPGNRKRAACAHVIPCKKTSYGHLKCVKIE
jgi:hypothetical protein